jgi:hypothetical protein
MDDDRLLALDWPGIDFNGDGQFTLLDVPELAIAWLLFPGDAAIDLLLRYAPAVTEFFELGRNDLGGPVSLCLSAIFWFIALVAITLVVNAIRNLDRRMTAWCTGRIEAGRTALRVVWRRLSCWIGQMRRRREAKKELVEVAAVDIATFDAAVLRCYGSVGEMRVLAAEDVATSLRCSLRNVKSALRTLLDYRLVEPAFGTDQGREGHQITRAGQIYLLER